MYVLDTVNLPLFQSSQLRPREHADLRRRNSSQHWFRRDHLDPVGHGGKRMRPRYNLHSCLCISHNYMCTCIILLLILSLCHSSSMIETSTFRHHGQSFSVDLTPINPAAPDLLAQLFWTATSLLESDYEGEYTMALRLMSRVS